ncbi:MAG: glycosyltransferase, partial [Bacteroidales bacterium]|nr:glycosyltransferase [Bacteroidales bacterium]
MNRIDIRKYDIDVFGLVEEGAFTDKLKHCRILPENKILRALTNRLEKQKGWQYVFSLGLKLLRKALGKKLESYAYSQCQRNIEKNCQYDTVIAYSEGVPTEFVSRFRTENKIAWIHCNYASYFELNNKLDESAIYDTFQKIICVSKATSDSFSNIYPNLKNRVKVIPNIIDSESMVLQSKEDADWDKTSPRFKIVSIGRLDPIKRFSIIPSIAKELRTLGFDFIWYVIGPKGGNPEEYDSFMKGIQSNGLNQNVLYLGEKKNPYPYIKGADLLVNTSLSEACPYVVNEALILGTPVLCTDFPSAIEFVENDKNGKIAPIEKFPEILSHWISSPKKIADMRANLDSFSYSNEDILN